MSSLAVPYGVVVVGSDADARYACERFSLHDSFRVLTEIHPADQSTLFSGLLKNDQVHVIYFAGPDDGGRPASNHIKNAMLAGKHVVLRSGVVSDASTLDQLAALVTEGVLAFVDEPRRWDDDFLNARSLIDSGKLGLLKRIRLAIHELKFPGELFSAGVLRDLGSHWIDQLLAFVDGNLVSSSLRRNFSKDVNAEDGFLAILEFTGGLSAMIEIQTDSLLSSRSGWFIEGTAGAYRNGRLYTKTADGEIVDEPVNRPADSVHGFVEALASAIGGSTAERSRLVSLSHAARVQAAIDSLLANETFLS